MRSSLLLVPVVALLGVVLAVACRQDDRVAPNPGTPIGPSANAAPPSPQGAASTAASAVGNGASTASP